mmetsp:Transcript_16838/g.46421  ORF Transcript_16838/g.46421 Transcript_16838/m.46421 type:complete len:256 (-) Transcript_16838:392-1159(-)
MLRRRYDLIKHKDCGPRAVAEHVGGIVHKDRNLLAQVRARIGTAPQVWAGHSYMVHQTLGEALTQLLRLRRGRRLRLQGCLQLDAHGLQRKPSLQQRCELLHQAVGLRDLPGIDAVGLAEGLCCLLAARQCPGVASHEPKQAVHVVTELTPPGRLLLLRFANSPLRLPLCPHELMLHRLSTGSAIQVLAAHGLPAREVAHRERSDEGARVAHEARARLCLLAQRHGAQQDLGIAGRHWNRCKPETQPRAPDRRHP